MPNANTEGYIAAMFEKAELRGASQWAQWFAECKRNGLNRPGNRYSRNRAFLVTLVVFGKISGFVTFASHFRTRAGLPKKSPACGLTQIGKIGLCSILAETTPTGSHTKLFTAEAFNLVLEIIKIGKNERPKKDTCLRYNGIDSSSRMPSCLLLRAYPE